ncbi:hypothetical protein LC147_11835 [Vibrio harveyi]|uniref:hypothetical protein n=1 Tax=Vibrio harveyi TaxID=669 RepID=UPI003BB52588
MTKEDITPREELAALGFNAALRLLGLHRNLKAHEAVEYVAAKMERAVPHIKQYQKVGVPPHAVPKVLEIMKENNIPFAKYQLQPTQRVIDMHQWRKTKC